MIPDDSDYRNQLFVARDFHYFSHEKYQKLTVIKLILVDLSFFCFSHMFSPIEISLHLMVGTYVSTTSFISQLISFTDALFIRLSVDNTMFSITETKTKNSFK